MADKKTKANVYEAMFLFPAAVASDLDHALMTARQMIERHGGEIIVLKKWDERKLAPTMPQRVSPAASAASVYTA